MKISKAVVEKVTGLPFAETAGKCHQVSIALVHKAVLPDGARVARGSCAGVPGQHSWVVIGDPYSPDAQIIDATLWSYRDEVEGVWHGTAADGLHVPHGAGLIFDWGKPAAGDGPVIGLDDDGLSDEAVAFLEDIGELDAVGWMRLFSQAPVVGWPAGEIIARAFEHEQLQALIPIDRVGMLTDINPGGLYQ